MLDFLMLWLLLLLPGLALLWKVWPEALEHGPLATVSLAYVASFGLLTPLCTLGYILRWPIATLALGYVACVVGSIAWGWRNLRLPTQLPRPSAVGVIVGCVIVGDLLLSTRNFSYMRGDAGYHVARVNNLLNQGLNNFDPLVPKGTFQVGYHSNLYHGLMAAFAWLTKRSAVEAWGFALAFAKLATAGGAALLASALLGSRFWSWIVGGIFAVHHLPYGMLTYPNTLALDWLMPTGLAIALEVLARRDAWGPRLLLGVVGLAAVQVHGLYYVFLVMIIGFVLAVDLLVQLRARLSLRPTALALAMLLLAAPWIVAGRLAPASPEYAAAAVRPHPHPTPSLELVTPQDPAETEGGFVTVGKMRMIPLGELHWKSGNLQLLLGLIVGILWPARRAAFLRLTAMLGVVAAVAFIPPLCELAIWGGGGAWMVKRLAYVLGIGWMAVWPGTLLLRIPGLTSRWFVQVLLCLAALTYAHLTGVDKAKLYSRGAYIQNAFKPQRVAKVVEDQLAVREVLKTVPRGATVWAPLDLDYRMSMMCNCYPLASLRGAHGARDMNQRRVDVRRLLDEKVPLKHRLAILRHYRMRHFYAPSRGIREGIEALYAGHVVKVHEVKHQSVVTIRYR